jgi:hypothetical protein
MMMKKILLFLFVAFTSLLGVAQVNLTQGLVAHYPFNGNANDQSGNGKNGVSNSVTLVNDRNGNPNSAYNFTSDLSYVSLPSTIITPSVAAVTICAWIKKAANWNTQTGSQIIYLGTGQGEMKLVFGTNSTTNPNLFFIVKLTNGSSYNVNFGGGLTNNQDYFLVAKYVKGQNISLYVNNVLVVQETGTFSSTSIPNLDLFTNVNATESIIGGYNNATGGYRFKGIIDDVRIYNRALTNQELIALYCPSTNLLLTGVTTANQAAETIIAPPTNPSGLTNTVNSGSNVTYRAINSITLNAGFNANGGSVFKAEMGGCKAYDLSANILSIAPQSVIDDLRLRGMNINEGNTPPALSGFFESKPHVLLSPYGPGDSFAVGTEFTSIRYRFYDQNGNTQTISLDKKSSDGTNTETGIGAFLAGNGNKFTLFAKTSGISDGITYKSLTIISGEILSTGIKDFQESVVLTEKGLDPTNKLIAVGQGRIIRDGNSLASKVSSLRLSAEEPTIVNVGKSMMSR